MTLCTNRKPQRKPATSPPTPADPSAWRERIISRIFPVAMPRWPPTPRQQSALAALRQISAGSPRGFRPSLRCRPATSWPPADFSRSHTLNRQDPHAPVKEFINAYADLFGYDASALRHTRITREDVTAHNGMRTTVWQQEVDGIPLYQTILKANVTKDGALVDTGQSFLADAAAATGMDAGNSVRRWSPNPRSSVKQAVSLAAANLGDRIAPEQATASSAAEGPRTQATIHRAAALRHRGAAVLAADERNHFPPGLGGDVDEPQTERDVPRAGGCAIRRSAHAHLPHQFHQQRQHTASLPTRRHSSPMTAPPPCHRD